MKHFLSYIDEAVKANWNSPALTNYGADTYTYGDVATNIERMHVVFEKCGIQKDDKIALCARSSAEWCIAYLAVVAYGATVVPLLPDFIPQNVADLTQMSDSRLLLVDMVVYGNLKRENIIPQFASFDDFRGIMNIKATEVYENCNGRLDNIIENAGSAFAERFPKGLDASMIDYSRTDLDALAVISYTSGTTSSSKGVMLNFRSLSENVEYGRLDFPSVPGDRHLSVLPLAHIFGQVFDFLFPLSSGAHVTIFTEKPIPNRLIKAFADVKPGAFMTVPLLVEKIFKIKIAASMRKPVKRFLLAVPGIRSILLARMRRKLIKIFGGNIGQRGLFIGGAALNKDVETALQMMKFPYSVMYGMTEVGPLISYKPYPKFVKHSCGAVAHPGVEARIDSTNPSKIPGEIQVKGPAVMLGYYKNEEATRAAFTSDGWLKTGDMAVIDKKENIFIKGRCKNMILSANGQNIYPEEIEEVINALPFVLESLVVGRKHGLAAIIVVNKEAVAAAGINDGELRKTIEKEVFAINDRLPSYSQISRCDMRTEPFEKTPKQSIKRFMYN